MSASTCLSVCLALICHQLCLSSTSASRLNHERRWLIPSTGGLGQQQPVPKELFVDEKSGSDNNPGTESLPFKTIIHARDTIRGMKTAAGIPAGGVIVNVREGKYQYLDAPLSLTNEDSGSPGSPIVYRALPSQENAAVWLTAGVSITPDLAEPVKHKWVMSLLHENAQDKVVQVDLKKLGISNFGELGSGMLGDCANDKLELKYQDKTMVLARYPNITPDSKMQFMQVSDVENPTSTFKYSDSRISQWKNTSTLWLHGFWSQDWADNYVMVDTVNKTSSTVTVNKQTPPVYGFKKSARFYALNLLEELDSEEEYYVDRGSGILYVLAVPQQEGCVTVGETVISASNLSFVTLDGFKVGCARQAAISAENVINVTLSNLWVGLNGGWSIRASGYNNTVKNISVFGNGCGGMSVSGGDTKSLTPGNNLVTNSTISNWSQWKRTYQPGLSWSGVGNNYTHLTLFNAPHAGILGGGNDCIFEYNYLHDLCYEVTDSGAFYTGRSWISRGNIIRYSHFANIQTTEKTYLGSPSVQAIYLDDQMSGYDIHNNLFENCYVGSFIGGGRRNKVHTNKYIKCTRSAVHIDDRGLSWQKADCSSGGMFEQQLKSVNYQNPPWSTHYPELTNIFEDHPCVPVYNEVTDNTYCGGTFIDISPDQSKEWIDTVTNNTKITC